MRLETAEPGFAGPSSDDEVADSPDHREIRTAEAEGGTAPIEESHPIPWSTPETGTGARPWLRRLGLQSLPNAIVLCATLLMTVSLFLPWAAETGSHPTADSSLAYSTVVALVILVLVAATWITYLLRVAHVAFVRAGLLTIALSLLLLLTYELGRNGCVGCQPVKARAGMWLAYVATSLYLLGGTLATGVRPSLVVSPHSRGE